MESNPNYDPTMSPMRYERFLSWGFGLGFNQGKSMERESDPALMINTGMFSEGNLERVKFAVGYVIMIFSANITNYSTKEIAGISETITSFIKRLINSEKLEDIDAVIIDFQDTIINEFYYYEDGRILLITE